MACRKCGGDHFNFVTCEQHAVRRAEQARLDRSPERFLRPREGGKDFGHRLYASEVNRANPNVVYIPRKSHPLYAPPKDAR